MTQTPTIAPARTPMFASLRLRNYRLFFWGGLISNIGTWMARIAQTWLVLTILLDVSYKRGKPDLNILFQYNMPLRALAKMTNGAISMGMVDGIVMELQGFWILGLVRVIYEAIKNVVLNAQMEKRLRGA